MGRGEEAILAAFVENGALLISGVLGPSVRLGGWH